MNKFVKYALWSLAIAVAFTATGAFAESTSTGNVFGTVLTRLTATFQNSRSVIFIIGGFGLIGLGFAAIFGKVKWTWLAALACGLAIVAVAGQVVDYVTRNDAAQGRYDVSGANIGSTGASGGYGNFREVNDAVVGF